MENVLRTWVQAGSFRASFRLWLYSCYPFAGVKIYDLCTFSGRHYRGCWFRSTKWEAFYLFLTRSHHRSRSTLAWRILKFPNMIQKMSCLSFCSPLTLNTHVYVEKAMKDTSVKVCYFQNSVFCDKYQPLLQPG